MLVDTRMHIVPRACACTRLLGAGNDLPQIAERGLWHGFDMAAVIAVVSSAMGGLIVAAVLKYADSVLKGYATAASVILTGMLSCAFFGTTLDLHFVLAMVTVTCSVFMYNDKGAAAAAPLVHAAPAEPDAKAEPEIELAEPDGRSR